MQKKRPYFVIGIMSGTSLDGLDLVYTQFYHAKTWKFKIISSTTYAYSAQWQDRLSQAHILTEDKLDALDRDYTVLLSEKINSFKKEYYINRLDAVCSHGHTVFHNPAEGLTYQIGNRPELAKQIDCMVVCDFRKQDVALGGQGAPLVPIGDQLLFSQYDACLNLGGFANCSLTLQNRYLAFDLCPVNTVLNRLVKPMGLAYDPEGSNARKGHVIPGFLERLNELPYYSESPPKSLGIEWVERFIIPLINTFQNESVSDLLHTFCVHAGLQIGRIFQSGQSVLVTGGGCFNRFLMEQIESHASATFDIPDATIVNYKEALIFALLGVLRQRNEINCLSSVTGAEKDHSSGSIFQP